MRFLASQQAKRPNTRKSIDSAPIEGVKRGRERTKETKFTAAPRENKKSSEEVKRRSWSEEWKVRSQCVLKRKKGNCRRSEIKRNIRERTAESIKVNNTEQRGEVKKRVCVMIAKSQCWYGPAFRLLRKGFPCVTPNTKQLHISPPNSSFGNRFGVSLFEDTFSPSCFPPVRADISAKSVCVNHISCAVV